MTRTAILAAALLVSTSAFALPADSDRVYTADQNSNTVSVIDPVANRLLGRFGSNGSVTLDGSARF